MKDPLEELLEIVTLQDFLAAIFWLAKDEQGRVPQSDGAIVRFLEGLFAQDLSGAPSRIKVMLEYGRYHIDDTLAMMHVSSHFEHPTDTRVWRRILKGQKNLELFTNEEQAYIAKIAHDFGSRYSFGS